MKTLRELAIIDNRVMKALKLRSISHYVLSTDQGPLQMQLRFEGTEADYKFVLDAVPVEESINEDLLKLFDGTFYGETFIYAPFTTTPAVIKASDFQGVDFTKAVYTPVANINDTEISFIKGNEETQTTTPETEVVSALSQSPVETLNEALSESTLASLTSTSTSEVL